MKAIQIFGLPRTCTNVVNVLIRNNFEAVTLINFPSWKHGMNVLETRKIKFLCEEIKDARKARKLKALTNEDDYLYVIICVKDPYRWLVSFYNHIIKRNKYEKLSFKKFVNNNECHYYDINIIEAFNKMLNHWLHLFNGENVYIVKSEDLIKQEGQLTFLNGVQSEFQLKRKSEHYKTEIKETLQGKLNKRTDPGEKSIYKPGEFLSYYDQRLLREINSRLYKYIVEKSGYTIKNYKQLEEAQSELITE